MAEAETAEQEEGQIADGADENSGQVVAQLIEAGEPAPGGELCIQTPVYVIQIIEFSIIKFSQNLSKNETTLRAAWHVIMCRYVTIKMADKNCPKFGIFLVFA